MTIHDDMLALSSIPLKYNSRNSEDLVGATQDLKRYLYNAGIIDPYKNGPVYSNKHSLPFPGLNNHVNNPNTKLYLNNKRVNNIKRHPEYEKSYKPYKHNNLNYNHKFHEEDMMSNFQLTDQVPLVKHNNFPLHLPSSHHNDYYKTRRKKPIRNKNQLDPPGSKQGNNHFVSPLYMRSPAAASVPIPKNMLKDL